MDKKNLFRLSILVLISFSFAAACVAVPREANTSMSEPVVIGNKEAWLALEKLDKKFFVLPDGTLGYSLKSAQTPDERNIAPLLLTYSDGINVILLAQTIGEDISYQFVEASIATAQGEIVLRGDQPVSYVETTLEDGKKVTELKWQEEGLIISLRSEDVGRDVLAKIASLLVHQ